MAKKSKSAKKDKKSGKGKKGKGAEELEQKSGGSTGKAGTGKAGKKGKKGKGAEGTKGTESKKGEDRKDAGIPPAGPTAAVSWQPTAPAPGRPDEAVGAAPQSAAQTPVQGSVDQVGVLKLALRDTEAKLVAAEHRLRQVQQQLDDERRALAEAFAPSAEAEESVLDAAVAETVAEAVVDAAVAETVAEAVVAAELATVVSGDPVDAAEVAAAALDDAADAVEAALTDEGEQGGPGIGPGDGAEQQTQRSTLTPPLPEQGPADEPNESWTLVHLRKEADRRGMTGVSNLTKAALVERLRG